MIYTYRIDPAFCKLNKLTWFIGTVSIYSEARQLLSKQLLLKLHEKH